MQVGLRRHLQGWELGLFVVMVAATMVFLYFPPLPPKVELPRPKINMNALSHIALQEEQWARETMREPLSVEGRVLGSAFRRLGHASALNDEREFMDAKTAILKAVREVGSEETLLRLRAYQTHCFVDEVSFWMKTKKETDELEQLAGPWISIVLRNGWIQNGHLVMTTQTLRTFYKKRWNDIVGTKKNKMALSRDEELLLADFLLRYPIRGRESDFGLNHDAYFDAQSGSYRLKKIDDIAQLDSNYPTDFAKSIVLYQSGELELAVDSLQRYLNSHPEGPFALRATNYLRTILQKQYTQ